MGLNDTQEMLDACRAHAAELDRDLQTAHDEIDRERDARLRLQTAIDELRRRCDDAEASGADGHGRTPGRPAVLLVADVRALIGAAPDEAQL